MTATNPLRDFSNALPESATGGAHQVNWYVNRSPDAQRDVVANLRQQINWDDQPSATYLFSGLRGSGKTTELNRLIAELEKEDGIAAFYCDASLYLNLNDPQISLAELLMTVLAGLSDAVRKRYGKDVLSDTIWQRTKRLLSSDVTFKPKLKTTVADVELEVEATLHENPDFRKKLIDFARESNGFYDEATQFVAELAGLIRQKSGSEKIVLVVDSLERISAPTGEENRLFDSLKELYFNDPHRLRLPGFSVVYSAPPYLSAVLPNVGSGFSDTLLLPNFKVVHRPTEPGAVPARNTDADGGIALMVDIVAKRHPTWDAVLDRKVLEELAWMSGGNVRHYFKMLKILARQAGLGKVALPIKEPQAPVVRNALSDAARAYQWLTGPDRKWLEHFRESSSSPARHITDMQKDLASIMRLFDHSLVLDYQNGSVWYQVPQLVRDCL